MNILKQTHEFLQKEILSGIKQKHTKLFTFGVKALTLRSFISLNANARMVIGNRSTAETKISRLVSNKSIAAYFPMLVKQLELVKPTDTINVDFSSFGRDRFQVLTFAKQTYLGRAIPVYFSLIQYPITNPGSQTLFVIKTIREFTKLLGFTPTLVCDRGFESGYIVKELVEAKIPFLIRMKKDKWVEYQKKKLPLRNMPWYETDTLVTIYDESPHEVKQHLRVVVSEKESERVDGDGKEESWYILTNDFVSSQEKVISTYYFRFEIEETFKDLKHINKLKGMFPVTKIRTITILLWFCILAIWVSFAIEDMKDYIKRRMTQKRRRRMSITKYYFEQLEVEKTLLLWTVLPTKSRDQP